MNDKVASVRLELLACRLPIATTVGNRHLLHQRSTGFSESPDHYRVRYSKAANKKPVSRTLVCLSQNAGHALKLKPQHHLRPEQLPQHVWQDAAVADVFYLDGGVYAAAEGYFFR